MPKNMKLIKSGIDLFCWIQGKGDSKVTMRKAKNKIVVTRVRNNCNTADNILIWSDNCGNAIISS